MRNPTIIVACVAFVPSLFLARFDSTKQQPAPRVIVAEESGLARAKASRDAGYRLELVGDTRGALKLYHEAYSRYAMLLGSEHPLTQSVGRSIKIVAAAREASVSARIGPVQ